MASTVAPATSLRSIWSGTRPSKNASRSAFSRGCAAGAGVAAEGFVSVAAEGAAVFEGAGVCGGSASAGTRVQSARRRKSERSRVMSPPNDKEQRTECLGNGMRTQQKSENQRSWRIIVPIQNASRLTPCPKIQDDGGDCCGGGRADMMRALGRRREDPE